MAPFFLVFLFIICVNSYVKQACYPVFYKDDPTIRCLPGDVIIVEEAWYGHTIPNICEVRKEGVCGVSVLRNAQRLCNGRQTCQLESESDIIHGVAEIKRHLCYEYGKNSITVNYTCLPATSIVDSCGFESYQIITVQADQHFSWPGSKSNCTYRIKTATRYLGMNLTIMMMNETVNKAECRKPLLKIEDGDNVTEIVSNHCKVEEVQIFHTKTNKLALTFMGSRRFIVGVRLIDLCKLGENISECVKANETLALYDGKNVTGIIGGVLGAVGALFLLYIFILACKNRRRSLSLSSSGIDSQDSSPRSRLAKERQAEVAQQAASIAAAKMSENSEESSANEANSLLSSNGSNTPNGITPHDRKPPVARKPSRNGADSSDSQAPTPPARRKKVVPPPTPQRYESKLPYSERKKIDNGSPVQKKSRPKPPCSPPPDVIVMVENELYGGL
ncbi:DgyrCDS6374 [Dimorphilus gyrociliatus]|uniref:DgyrCDS6374 n=1 Tax=Dimorphilus gyrociliatus TaxID=2664684 RepID=A0A7I8VN19_9ANNE|nr:DgyrCDS6374 [Dimorphilus gyrociliatus]